MIYIILIQTIFTVFGIYVAYQWGYIRCLKDTERANERLRIEKDSNIINKKHNKIFKDK